MIRQPDWCQTRLKEVQFKRLNSRIGPTSCGSGRCASTRLAGEVGACGGWTTRNIALSDLLPDLDERETILALDAVAHAPELVSFKSQA